MQPERGIDEVQYRIIRADGSVCWIGNGSHAVYDQQGNFMGIRGSNRDISDRKRIESLLISSNQNIVKTIIQTEENERANFSKELHDGLGPLLSAIKMYLQWSQRPKSSNSREEIIIKAQDILEDALTTVKEISNKLSPRLLINYGLTSAVQSFVDKLEETSAITIDFRSNTARRFTNEIEVTLYRVLIECINNTMKHAGASNIWITIVDSGNQIRLEYSDDGSGFNMAEVLSEQKGLGLFNLQNRIQTIGGKISLSSEPGKGVDYRVTIDLEEEHILKS
jgi:signal transduction histidine kinase